MKLSRSFRGLLVTALTGLAASCGGSTPSAPGSGYRGEWTGTTSQGTAISFTVSAEQKMTAIVVGYSFNGCSGTKTFPGISLPIAVNPQQPGLPGFEFNSGPRDQPNYVGVMGTFATTDTAAGLVVFGNYESCNNGLASWSAVKR
jgi:hypothetical protein